MDVPPQEINGAAKGRVLLVDDEPMVLESYRRALGNAGFKMATASSGEQGLKEIWAGRVAVVVADLKMPGMDGIEFLAEVREHSPDTVRILLTGHADLDNAIRAVNRGNVFRILTKPCSPEDLLTAIDAGLVQHSMIIERSRFMALKKVHASLEKVVLGFSTLVEMRDPYTAGHQERVTRLCQTMAQVMGLDRERSLGLRMGAMVHDLGKIYVPSAFLNKPGRLTETEFGIIKAHPVVGYEILKAIDFDWPVAEIVRQHHERLDGSGYPEGLSGRNILKEARILAVADVVDAMSSHRPYRPGLGQDKALEEIKAQRGKTFDGDAVDACLSVFANGLVPDYRA